ncbi:unnamed protein product [Sphacelaria rigidula]
MGHGCRDWRTWRVRPTPEHKMASSKKSGVCHVHTRGPRPLVFLRTQPPQPTTRTQPFPARLRVLTPTYHDEPSKHMICSAITCEEAAFATAVDMIYLKHKPTKWRSELGGGARKQERQRIPGRTAALVPGRLHVVFRGFSMRSR